MPRGLRGGHAGLVRVSSGLAVPVIGLGASAQTYYPAVGELLGTDMILPEHAGVANAVGAVVGQITMRRQATITAPSEGQFRVHLDTGPQDFTSESAAFDCLETALTHDATAAAKAAGAVDIQINIKRDIKKAQTEAREVFVEATVIIEASGRPRIT